MGEDSDGMGDVSVVLLYVVGCGGYAFYLESLESLWSRKIAGRGRLNWITVRNAM